MTGSCTIKASTIVGLGCAAEYYELEDLRQACQERLSDCMKTETVCKLLCEIELYYDYHTAKSMLMKVRTYMQAVLVCEYLLLLLLLVSWVFVVIVVCFLRNTLVHMQIRTYIHIQMYCIVRMCRVST